MVFVKNSGETKNMVQLLRDLLGDFFAAKRLSSQSEHRVNCCSCSIAEACTARGLEEKELNN